MRISASACLHRVLWAALVPILSSAFQTPLEHLATSTTLVDALNADPDYTSLLHLFQRARLIPTLNRLNGSTLFAPTNDAIKKASLQDPLWLTAFHDTRDLLPDNVQEQLRQQLFYHLLNETLPALPSSGNVLFYKTLLYPRKLLDPPSRPPANPPWMPISNGTLGSEPQRLRLAAREGETHVAVDAFGNGGIKIVKEGQSAGNGIIFGIDEMIIPPPDLATTVSQHHSMTYFGKIMNSEIKDRLNSSSQLTLFLPTDDAWDQLDPIERLYLESEFATDDLHRILDMHAVAKDDGVVWSDSFKGGLSLTSVQGTELNITSSPDGVKVGDAELIHPDIYASNGVVHLVSSLLLPPGTLQLTPQKYLMALNCTKFVSLLDSVNLTNLINDTDTKYTILAPRDDIIAIFDDPAFPPPGSDELKKLLQYHFILGNWTTVNVKHGTLLKTALKEPGLNDMSQVLPVEIHSDDEKTGARSIRFGGAGVIGDPVEANNTVIYFISRPLVPPTDVIQVALPFLDFSSFLAALSSTSKADILRTTPSTSFLIPENEAFKRLGLLVSAHLLAPSSKGDLENVMMHHVLKTVEYSKSLQNGSQHTFSTLEGSDVTVERLPHGDTLVSSSGGWAGFKSKVQTRNLLTQTGVIHEMTDIMIPRSVQITIGKLVKAAKGSTMATLVNKAGFDWILNGTAPPDGSPWTDEKYGNAAWTLLCPPDEAFKTFNLTRLLSDVAALQDIVSQHLIPTPPGQGSTNNETPLNNNRPLTFDGATYSTVRSTDSEYGDLVFEQVSNTQEYIVGIKGARGKTDKHDWARVTAWGRSTTGFGKGGVVQIDRLLVPYQPSWWVMYGAPLLTGSIGVFLISLFFYGVRAVWRRDMTEATYEPVGGFGRDDE